MRIQIELDDRDWERIAGFVERLFAPKVEIREPLVAPVPAQVARANGHPVSAPA